LKRTPRNLRYHELIGLRVRVLRHLDPGLSGLEGRVVWETERALVVEAPERGRLLILKSGALLAFHIPGWGSVVVPGDELLGTPVDRVKRLRR